MHHFIHFYPIKNHSSQHPSLLFWEMRTEKNLCSLNLPNPLWNKAGYEGIKKMSPILNSKGPGGQKKKGRKSGWQKRRRKESDLEKKREKKLRTHFIWSKGCKGPSPGLISSMFPGGIARLMDLAKRYVSTCVREAPEWVRKKSVTTGRKSTLLDVSFLFHIMDSQNPVTGGYCED